MDRFDLEMKISNASLIIEDLECLAEYILETNCSSEDVCNILMGLSGLQKARHNALWNAFVSTYNLSDDDDNGVTYTEYI